MPGVGKAADDKLVAVVARRVLWIEEELKGRGSIREVAADDVVMGAIGGGALAIDERRALAGDGGVWFRSHRDADASRAVEIDCCWRHQLSAVS